MLKSEIINTLSKMNMGSIISFPNRGLWGKGSYRGNTSGWVIAYLLWKYNVQKMAELFSGSGTGYDVAKDMGIPYIGADLNPSPVRPGILSLDALVDEVPDGFRDADFIFAHPPYSSMIGIKWAGESYGYKDPTGELATKDLGNMPWEEFIKALNCIVMKYYAAMPKGGRMGILMGDVRRNGSFRSMLADIVKPGLDQIIIKQQHNCVSNGRTYSSTNFVPIEHEYVMILKKALPYALDFSLPKEYFLDIRDSEQATWKDVVLSVLHNIKEASLDDIYAEIEGKRKAASNPHWKEKVRQTLQVLRDGGLAKNVNRGFWAVA